MFSGGRNATNEIQIAYLQFSRTRPIEERRVGIYNYNDCDCDKEPWEDGADEDDGANDVCEASDEGSERLYE